VIAMRGCQGIRHSHGLPGAAVDMLILGALGLVEGTLAGALLAVRLDATAKGC
jgi:hypothetical protein